MTNIEPIDPAQELCPYASDRPNPEGRTDIVCCGLINQGAGIRDGVTYIPKTRCAACRHTSDDPFVAAMVKNKRIQRATQHWMIASAYTIGVEEALVALKASEGEAKALGLIGVAVSRYGMPQAQADVLSAAVAREIADEGGKE